MADDRDHTREEEMPDVSHIKNEDVSHEVSDVKIRPIVMFLFWLTVAAIVIHLLMAGLYKILEDHETKAEGKASPMSAERKVIPPEPRLQLAPTEQGQPSPRFMEDNPLNDLKKLRADEDAKLNNYEANPNTGTARIPIADAKEMVIKDGALNQPSTTESRDQRPSRSNSGRGMVKPEQKEVPHH